jgi:hypothetical protein
MAFIGGADEPRDLSLVLGDLGGSVEGTLVRLVAL